MNVVDFNKGRGILICWLMLKFVIKNIHLVDVKAEGGGLILMNLNRKGCVRSMHYQLRNLEPSQHLLEDRGELRKPLINPLKIKPICFI